jgi:uncharacterized spore protein YtfJ
MAVAKSESQSRIAHAREAEVASEQFVRVIQELGAQICTRSNASAVFGAPVEYGDRTVIPVAHVVAGFGAGGGAGKESQEKDRGGGGLGGGGGFIVHSLGVFELSGEGVHFRPCATRSNFWIDVARLAWRALRLGR